jgi:HSP20 family protein
MVDSENRTTIRIHIRDLRRSRSLTQEELAEALGISRQSVNAMEAGRCLPSLPVALQIASFFAQPLHAVFALNDAQILPEQSISNLEPRRKEETMNHLTPWTPFREMREMLDDMMENSLVAATPAAFLPAVNISQTEKEVHVDLRLPGYKKDDLSIEVGEDFLTVSGETQQENEEQNKQYARREFAQQSFSRTIALPALVQTEKAEAEMKHGVLTVRLQKAVEEKPKTKRIEIKAE